MNIFDRAKIVAYKATASIMGYNAEWYDNATEQMFTARVHFKYPTQQEQILPEYVEMAYTPTEPIMEYLEGSFPGLKESVDGNGTEQVSIDGKGDFYVRSVTRKYDGETLTAVLAPV